MRGKFRQAKRDSKRMAPYPSRAKINRAHRAAQFANRLAQGLGDISTKELNQIIDEYYINSEIPTADQLTEMVGMGLWDIPKNWVVTVSAASALILLGWAYLKR